MNLPPRVVMESHLCNPKLQFYISTNHVGLLYNSQTGEVPQGICPELSKALHELVMSGQAVRVLSPIMDVDYLPENSCIAVVSQSRTPSAELLYSEKLTQKGFSLCEQLVIQKHIHIPQWNWGPLVIDRMDDTGPHEYTRYTWMTNSGSGHVDWVNMSDDEMKGVERLIEKGVFTPEEHSDPIYGMRITKLNPSILLLPEYIQLSK